MYVEFHTWQLQHQLGCVNMSQRIKANKHFLKYLARSGKRQRKALLQHANPEEIKSICECMLNVYRKNVPLSNDVVDKLRPFRKTIISVGNSPKMSNLKRKRLLNQHGGAFLPILLSALLPTVLSLIKK